MFIELLIVLGLLGIISAVVIVAINPRKHLCESVNAKRAVFAREMTNAVNQYLIRTYNQVQDIPVGVENATPICRYGVTGDLTCMSLDALVPDYTIALPQDELETNANYSGYRIYRHLSQAGLNQVESAHVQDCQNL